MKHPFTDALYVCQPNGNVHVTDGEREGWFRPDGSWIEGDLREADPQFCGWIAGDKLLQDLAAK